MVATAGTMTLRKAIRLSNSDNTQQNTINFAIPGAGLHTIDVGLPGLTISGNNFGVIIDGFTQAGSLANTASIGSALLATYTIEIKSTSGVPQLLTINSNNNIIKGICFNDAGTTTFSMNDIDIKIQQSRANVHIEDLPVLDAVPSQMHQLFQNLILKLSEFWVSRGYSYSGAVSVSATVRPSDLPVVGSTTSSAATVLRHVAVTCVTLPSGADSTSVARSSMAAMRCASRASAASHPTTLIETRGRSSPGVL
jgi:hypothetical protein